MLIGSQPRQIVSETLSQKKSSQQGAGGVAQGIGPEFKIPVLQKEAHSLKLGRHEF
jgi:hypothetical protein